jgi:hypothetical protein
MTIKLVFAVMYWSARGISFASFYEVFFYCIWNYSESVVFCFSLYYSFYNRNGSGRFGAVNSDSTHHFFGNACTKSGPLRFSQFSGC